MPKGHYTPKGFTTKELESLEEITFKNMVAFYQDELNRLLNGELGTKVLTKGDRRCLRRHCILCLKGTGSTGRRLEITPKAQELLNEINEWV
ncbi:MAG: hypothetical protein JSV20_01995 [Candidatus Bathyarchaeota archaeon]|nr:MAG: hypothetical protein JSV20_01995 [Candidatus Bathyarchaeota archaeon]